jgi:hypothetical protein
MSYVNIFLRYILGVCAQTTNNRRRIFINKEADPQDVHPSYGSKLVPKMYLWVP